MAAPRYESSRQSLAQGVAVVAGAEAGVAGASLPLAQEKAGHGHCGYRGGDADPLAGAALGIGRCHVPVANSGAVARARCGLHNQALGLPPAFGQCRGGESFGGQTRRPFLCPV